MERVEEGLKGDLEENWYVVKVPEMYEGRGVNYILTLRKTPEFRSLTAISEFKIPHDSEGAPALPGYLFIRVRLTPDIYYKLPKVPYINYWVGARITHITKKILSQASPLGVNFPRPLTDEDLKRLDAIIELCKDKDINQEIVGRNLIPDGFYEITGGSLKGIKCIFHQLDERNPSKAKIDALVFRRPVPMTISIKDIGERVDYWEEK